MSLGVAFKRPDDVRDFDVYFDDWLPEGDTIQSATADIGDGAGIDSVVVTSDAVKVWVSGGESGKTYTVSVVAETSGGRVKETCFKLRMRNC